MRLTLAVDGERFEVETEGEPTRVRVGDRSFPVRVLSSGPDRVELEIGGERAVVTAWPSGSPQPPVGVAVNGEVVRVELEVRSASTEPASRGPVPAAAPAPAPTSESGGNGVAVLPPMPGKILEVRVREGDTVAAGQLLAVLEAMKMRNEILSPAAGRVEGLRASAGQSVRAREVLLRIVLAADERTAA
jgi:glutaconyl-CoA/methylmalonyl-CoA decarboxylase subunit gamma